MSAQLPSDFLPESSELHDMHELHTTQDTKPFPTHLLPRVLGDLVKEVARVTQTPEAMAGPLTLGIVSATIGKGLASKGHAGSAGRAGAGLRPYSFRQRSSTV